MEHEMDRDRIGHVAIWTISLALVGMFLGLGKGPLLLSKVATVLEGAIGGGLIGFGFGITFSKPRNSLDRRLKIVYAALPFGIIGALVGKALGIEDAPVGSDPGFHSTIMGTLWGIAVGFAVGLIVFLTSRGAVESPTTSGRQDEARR